MSRSEKQRAYDREYKRKWRAENPERWKAIRDRHEEKVKQDAEATAKRRAYAREWYAKNPDKSKSEKRKEGLRKAAKKRYEKQPEAVLAANRKWAAENRAWRKRYNSLYYQENRDTLLPRANELSLLRYHADPEAALARKREWCKKNRDKENARIHRRRARKAGEDSPGVTVDEWMAIKELFEHRCAYCFVKPHRLTRDHIVPLCRGGRDAPGNIAPACLRCNSSKNSKLLSEWLFPTSSRFSRAIALRLRVQRQREPSK